MSEKKKDDNKEKDTVKKADSSKKSGSKKDAVKKSDNALKKTAKYFKDLKVEFKKVTWPKKDKVFNNTIAVISGVLLIGTFIALVDAGLISLFDFVTVKR